ncbi:MAG: hypothetical protein Q7U51_07565 [Methanoregula sp.]|nr:hypothetical protein [Methanoregula sp.]
MSDENRLPFLQTLDWRKILFGLAVVFLAIAYLMRWLPGLENSNPYSVAVGLGLYWLALNFLANGIFTDADRNHRLNLRIDQLSQKLEDMQGTKKNE